MNPDLDRILAAAGAAIDTDRPAAASGPYRVGVDLGTANTVIFVVDAKGEPVVGAYQWAQVVRDGLVVDFAGACAILRRLKADVERRLGQELEHAATAYPPGVARVEVRATEYVLESAGLHCTAFVDEPTAANAVLGATHGAVVDIGGGTTGIAVIEDGNVVYTADEPTGGTHFSLVIAGAHDIPFEEAEQMKCDVTQHRRLFSVVRPVMEKVGSIVARHVEGRPVDVLYLVGGTSSFTGIADVIAEVTGIPTVVPSNPLFVTPLGVALHDLGSDKAYPDEEGVHHG